MNSDTPTLRQLTKAERKMLSAPNTPSKLQKRVWMAVGGALILAQGFLVAYVSGAFEHETEK